MYRRYYIAPGTFENWRIALQEANVWGLPEGRESTWRSLMRGDVLFSYVESPISAVVGYCEIQDTFYDRGPFFADDRGGATKWPLRFRFKPVLASLGLPMGPGVSVDDMLKFPRLKRFEMLKERQGDEILRRCKESFSAKSTVGNGAGT